MNRRAWLLFILAATWFLQAPVQASNIRFDRLTAEQGLSQSSVLTFAQDAQGFLWFGTQEGLNRYDGYEFVTYTHDNEAPDSLANDWVIQLFVDSSGRLWVGMDNGALDRYDPLTDSFTHVLSSAESTHRNYVRGLVEDTQGAVWVATDGLGLQRIDRDSQQIEEYLPEPDDPSGLPSAAVKDLQIDSQGIIWVATDGSGLVRLDPDTRTFSRVPMASGDPYQAGTLRLNSIIAMGAEDLWLGTYESGLLHLNTRSRDVTAYRHIPGDSSSLSSDAVRALLIDSDGVLWVGTDDDGLDRFNRVMGSFEHYRNLPADFRSLSDDHVQSLFQDRGGVIWVGTMGGINKWNPAMGAFATYTRIGEGQNQLSNNWVTSFAQTDRKHIWVGTHGGGVNRIDLKSGESRVYRHIDSDAQSLNDDRVFALSAASDSQLWVGTKAGGLNRLDIVNGTFKQFRHDPTQADSLSSDGVTALLTDHKGRLWVGTYLGGLNLYRPESGGFQHFRANPEDPRSLSSDRVLTLLEDANNRIWVATHDGGFCQWQEAARQFDCVRSNPDGLNGLGSNATWTLHEDHKGNLWIGTQDDGLYLWKAGDRAEDVRRFSHYGKAQGLPSNMVYGILSDLAGFVWLSTNHGLSRLDPVSQTFRNYDVTHGLQNNEFNFGAQFRSDDGSMFFGGISGFNRFQPEQIRINSHPPQLALTSVSIMNLPVNLQQLFDQDQGLELGYRDRMISLEYVALDFTAPASNRYRHRLIGFDNDWIEDGTVRRATYTNLIPGDYRFEVSAINNDGIESKTPLTMTLYVAPPPWATRWAQMFYLLVILAIGTLLVRNARRKAATARSIQATNEALQREIKRRKVQEAALQREKQLAQSYLDVVEVIIIALDPQGTLLLVNQKGTRVLGYSEDELLGKNFYEFLVPRPFRAKMREQFSDVDEYDYSESPVTTKDGSERLIAWHETPLANNGSQQRGLLISGVDITQTRSLEHQVREAQKMEALGTLAGGIAHDFNNVLSSMMGFTELSMSEADSGSKIQRHLSRIMLSIHRARDLVQSILTFSRRSTQEPVATSIHAVVQESLQLIRPSLPSNITIQVNVDNNCGAVRADPNQLHQLVMNLCTNAYQAMTDSGGALKLDILCQEVDTELARSNPNLHPGNYVKLVVSDTGHGISQSHINRIFEPFFSTKKRGEGTGLGLSIVHGIVHQIGGAISVHSRLGQGTRFDVLLPECEETAEATESLEPGTNLVLAGSETLLFVDDEQSMIAIARESLSKLGYTLHTASNAREAFEIWQRLGNEIDLIITDLTMPGMPGSELAEKIRQAGGELPIILMSGGELDMRERDTVDQFLNKPFTANQLARAIRKLLDSWNTSEIGY